MSDVEISEELFIFCYHTNDVCCWWKIALGNRENGAVRHQFDFIFHYQLAVGIGNAKEPLIVHCIFESEDDYCFELPYADWFGRVGLSNCCIAQKHSRHDCKSPESF